MKMTSADLFQMLRFNGKRWNDYEGIHQALTDAEGEPVTREDALALIDELLAAGMLGQRVHPTYKHRQYIVA